MTTNQTSLHLLFFSQPDCGVCTSLKTKVYNLIKTQFSEVQFEEIELLKEPKRGADFMIFSSPVIVILYENKEVYRKAGNMALFELENDIKRLITLTEV